MKTIGMIGGMSWESSVEYYRIVNEVVRARLGGLHSAVCLMYSVDFAEIEALQHAGRWAEAGVVLCGAARSLQRGGADCVVICTNTMHKLAEVVQEAVTIPLVHIADATAQRVLAGGIAKIGLLGTKFTMEEAFYRGRLEEKFGLEVVVPPAGERDVVHQIIYDELCMGVIKADSKAAYVKIMAGLIAEGAEGIILGCTEIGLLVSQPDSRVPLFDTTFIHAEAAVDFALKGE